MRTTILAMLLMAGTGSAQTTPSQTPATGVNQAMTHATGSFDVKIVPTGHAPDATLNSMSIDKTFHGDLEGTSKGEMLSAGDPASGNAGYVAMERVTGTVGGKTGSFALMHSGVMIKGTEPKLTVTIVPGSGTDGLSGIYGSLTITIAGGKHSYTLDYAFATP